jgi:hypothetical protein
MHRLSHIPLVLFYSSLTKLSLLLLLSIWRPASPSSGSSFGLPESATWYSWVKTVIEAFDEDKLDREWVVRNMLGGMAAGFGLRGEGSDYFLDDRESSHGLFSGIGLSSSLHNGNSRLWMGGENSCCLVHPWLGGWSRRRRVG